MAKNRYKRAEKVFPISLGAGCRRFESCHSDHLSLKNRLKRRFFCVNSSILSFAWPHFNCGQRDKMAVLVTVQKNAEISKSPNPSLTGAFLTFLCVGVT